MNKYRKPAEIIGKLREAEIFLSKGVKMDAVFRPQIELMIKY